MNDTTNTFPTLAAYMAADPPLPDFLTVLHKLAQTVDSLHSCGQLCLTLSPAWVRIRQDGSILLSDSLKPVPMEALRTGIWQLPAQHRHSCYIAPEVIRYEGRYMERRQRWQRADVYTLGMILCAYLYGEETAASPDLLSYPGFHTEIADAVHAALQQLLSDTLSRFPINRLSSAGEFAQRIEKIQTALPH